MMALTEIRPAHHESCPDGSYKDSCNGCKFEGGVLSCVECSGPEGKNKDVSFTVGDCKLIGNVNGAIACEDKGTFFFTIYYCF
jgi:hypothetical protein